MPTAGCGAARGPAVARKGTDSARTVTPLGSVSPCTKAMASPACRAPLGIYMTQAPSPIHAYYRKMFKALVYQALVD